jgi:glutamyl-tRNA synthetase
MQEMADNFDIKRVSANPARFDIKKCTAINADWIRKLSTEELAQRITDQLVTEKFFIDKPTTSQSEMILKATPLVQERLEKLSQAQGMLSFLLIEEKDFKVNHEDAESSLTHENMPVLEEAIKIIESINEFETTKLHDEFNKVIVQQMGLKPRVAFTAIRVAVTGRKVSPPLFESMELLGKEKVLSRIRQQIKK